MKLLTLILALSLGSQIAWAESVDFEKLATAIYHAEGADKAVHKYGILAKYKHTPPRKACLNTITKRYKLWVNTNKQEGFIDFLQKTYAPINCENDNGTNKFWARNVTYFYNKT